MKHLWLALACFPAFAAPLPAQNIANMVAQSDAVMSAGMCAVANDQKPKKGEKMTLLLPIGVRQILVADYQWIRGAGYAKNKRTGRWIMSERIEAACKEAESGRCLAARSYWSQQPIATRPPGNGVKVQ